MIRSTSLNGYYEIAYVYRSITHRYVIEWRLITETKEA